MGQRASAGSQMGAGPAGRWTLLRWLFGALLLGGVVLHDGAGRQADRIRQAADPFSFNLVDWELGALGPRLPRIGRALLGEPGSGPADDPTRRAAFPAGRVDPPAADDEATVRAYFQSPAAARPALRAAAEPAVERLVSAAWLEEGLAGPSPLAGGRELLFPPVSFTFTEPPMVLIVSPRERIEVRQSVLLRPALDPAEVARLEDGAASLGLASLVTPIGGLATYPAMVLEAGSAQATLASVAHEWVHAYFFFAPLGRGYWSDQELRTINETAAELAGNELGRRLAARLGLPTNPLSARPSPRQAEFDDLLRQTRQEVDRLLAADRVEAAEAFMEQRRLELNARGFAVRRLNQAYFAFHGSYGGDAAASSASVARVRELRARSAGLGAFLRAVAAVERPDDLAGR